MTLVLCLALVVETSDSFLFTSECVMVLGCGSVKIFSAFWSLKSLSGKVRGMFYYSILKMTGKKVVEFAAICICIANCSNCSIQKIQIYLNQKFLKVLPEGTTFYYEWYTM